MDLLISTLPLILSAALITYLYARDRAHGEYLDSMKTKADRRFKLAALEAESELLKAERPNSLDKIIK